MTTQRTGLLAVLIMGVVCLRAAGISYGDVWYAEQSGEAVLISGTDGTVLAQTSGLPRAEAIACDPSDGSLWAACDDDKIYHVSTDGSFTEFCDLSNCPTGEAVSFSSVEVVPVALGGGLYVKDDDYGGWGLYRILDDGTVYWCNNHGRANGAHAMGVDYVSGNVVLANGFNGSINIYDKADGIRLGGNTSDYHTGGNLDIYQQDGTIWTFDNIISDRVVKLAPDCSNTTPDAFFPVSNVKDLIIDQTDGTVWLLARDPVEIIHIEGSGKPAAELTSFASGDFYDAWDMDLADDGTLWVADYKNRQVAHYAADGTEIARYDGLSGNYLPILSVYRQPVDMSGAGTALRTYPARSPLATGTHPRLFLSTADLPDIRNRITSGPWATWYAEVKAQADASMVDPIPPFSNLNGPTGTWISRLRNARFLSFVGMVEDDPSYLDRARLTMTWKTYQSSSGGYGGDMSGSDTGIHMALAYDMTYSVLQDQDKTFYEKAMELTPVPGYERLDEGGWYGGWGWSGNPGTKTVGGMGMIALAIGPGNAAWAQDYYDMTLAMIEHSLDTHFDSQGLYNESQGYLATGWFNLTHVIVALMKTGGTDYFKDERFVRWNRALAETANPGGAIVQFEDASLTGGYMMMTSSLPMTAALAPAADSTAKAWMKYAYLAAVQHHPYRSAYGGEDIKYTYTSLYADMPICAVSQADWDGISEAPPPNVFLPEKNPDGGRGHYVWRTGMDWAADVHLAMNSRWKCGWPYSTHEHMDGGSIELFGYGARLLVSPGYTTSGGPAADWQDSTLAANTLIADRDDDGTLEIVDDRQDGGDGWSDNNGPNERAMADQIGFACSKYDFWYDSDPAFTRNLFFVGKSAGGDPYVVVVDDADLQTASRKVAVTWHCRGSATITGQTGEWVVAADNNGPDVTLNVNVVKPEGLAVSSDVGSFYPMYGSAGTGWEDYVTYLIAESSGSASVRFMTVLYPRREGQALPTISGVSGEDACYVGSDDLFLTQDEPFGSITVEGVTTDAEMAFVRKAGAGNVDGLSAKNGTSLDFGGAGYSSNEAVTLALMDFSGAVETYADNVELTVNDPDISAPVTVRVDGSDVPSTVGSGSVTFTVAAAGHHLVEIIVGNTPPTAVISTTPAPAEGLAPLTVQFDGSASSDTDGSIASWEWDFAYDGVTFNTQATGATTSHEYASAGSYTAALRVTDDGGATDIATVPVTATAANSAPTAAIDASPTSGAAPLNVGFDASLSSDPDSDTLTYHWDFDYDGVTFDVNADTGTVATTSHEYASTGTFTAAVRVDDGNGHSDIDTIEITVTSGPDISPPVIDAASVVLNGTVGDDSGCPPTVVVGGVDVTVTNISGNSGEWTSEESLDQALVIISIEVSDVSGNQTNINVGVAK